MHSKIKIAPATPADHDIIDRIRHEVYACELGQFSARSHAILKDRTGVRSIYIVAHENEELVGFVGITPPSSPAYSIDQYIERPETGLEFNDGLFEIRSLTVIDESRGTLVAPALMVAALRWTQAHGGTQLIAIGHEKVRDMYVRLGMRSLGKSFRCGNLNYELLHAPVESIKSEITRFSSRLNRLKNQLDWQLKIPFQPTKECYHGGAFFEAIGNTFKDLNRRNTIINADVLDAWFPPCPQAMQALHEHLGWMARTSPPNHAEGLVNTIARVRGVKSENLLMGGGSSPLIYLALTQWLKPGSKTLILNPMYGEYAHVLEKVAGCNVERFKLDRKDGYKINPQQLSRKLSEGFDLMIWVNPNSPTGRHMKRNEVEKILRQCPASTRIWIDETYVEYAGVGQSLESYAAASSNVVIVKSMSKVYGLSGLRVGYLCGPPELIGPLRHLTPPWSVSLPAQVAAVKALENPHYYLKLYKETAYLRSGLVDGLKELGIHEIVPGIGNFVLFHLPPDAPNGKTLIKACREQGLFIRDASEMGYDMGDRAIRIAVKDAKTNQRMLDILDPALKSDTRKVPCHD